MARLRMPDGAHLAVPVAAAPPPGPALLSVRPEQLMLHDEAAPDRFPVELALALPLGGQTIHEATTQGGIPLRLTEPRLGASATAAPAPSAAWCPAPAPPLSPTRSRGGITMSLKLTRRAALLAPASAAPSLARAQRATAA